jgi:hyperosmotically inducible protein
MRKILVCVCALFVLALLAGCNRKSSYGEIKTDSDITMAVKEKLKGDEKIDTSDIDVDTKDGVVTLKGEVDTKDEADHAVQVARSIPEVKEVQSELKVEKVLTNEDVKERVENSEEKAEDKLKPETDESMRNVAGDAAITTKVKLAFAKDDQVSALKIDVDTKNGQVTLTGTVKSDLEARRAVQIAEGVEGVKRVSSVLTVKP